MKSRIIVHKQEGSEKYSLMLAVSETVAEIDRVLDARERAIRDEAREHYGASTPTEARCLLVQHGRACLAQGGQDRHWYLVLDFATQKNSFLWKARSYAIVVWRPGAPPAAPRYARLEPDPLPVAHACTQLRLRTCRLCGRVRVLPRHASAAAARPTATWECRLSPDSKYNRCEAPEWVPMCVK